MQMLRYRSIHVMDSVMKRECLHAMRRVLDFKVAGLMKIGWQWSSWRRQVEKECVMVAFSENDVKQSGRAALIRLPVGSCEHDQPQLIGHCRIESSIGLSIELCEFFII